MKILFDQNAPRPLARFLTEHEVTRAAEMDWSELRNGELLLAAEEAGFDLMVTADRNLSYQQNLAGRKLAIVILPSGQWPEIQPHFSAVIEAIDGCELANYVDLTALRNKL